MLDQMSEVDAVFENILAQYSHNTGEKLESGSGRKPSRHITC